MASTSYVGKPRPTVNLALCPPDGGRAYHVDTVV